MNAARPAMRIRPAASSLSRPVVEVPALSVVPSPAPRKGFRITVLVCALLFAGALLFASYLNTRMVAGAYQIKDIKSDISAAQMREDSLQTSALGESSPDRLRAKAADLGMVPAQDLRELNVLDGTLSSLED